MTDSFLADFHELWTLHFPDLKWPGEVPAAIYVFNRLTELREQVAPHAALPMRTQEEMVYAHDTMAQLILHREYAPGIDPEVFNRIADFTQTLCWVLKHTHSHVLETYLEKARIELANCYLLLHKGEYPNG